VPSSSLFLAERIARPPEEVYAYASDPTHLPAWASGLGSGVEQIAGEWYVESPMGRVRIRFAEPNAFGVLDHDVTLPSGETVRNPMRVTPDGDGAEVVFTLRRAPGVSDEEFARDAGLVAGDLARLKAILEGSDAPD